MPLKNLPIPFIVQEDLHGKDWWRGVYQNAEWPDADGVVTENEAGVSVVGLSSDLASLQIHQQWTASPNAFVKSLKRR